MTDRLFESMDRVMEEFPEYSPVNSQEKFTYEGRDYRLIGTAQGAEQHDLLWRVKKAAQAILLSSLSLLLIPLALSSYRQMVAATWEMAITGREPFSIYVKYISPDSLEGKVKRLQADMTTKENVAQFLQTASEEEIKELVKQSNGSGAVRMADLVDIEMIAKSTTTAQMKPIVQAIGDNTNKLYPFFEELVEEKVVNDKLTSFLNELSEDQKNGLFKCENSEIWRSVLAMLGTPEAHRLPLDFRGCCQTVIKKLIETGEFNPQKLSSQQEQEKLFSFIGLSEPMGKFLKAKYESSSYVNKEQYLKLVETVFAEKVTAIPEMLFNAILIPICDLPAKVILSASEREHIKGLIKNSLADSDLRPLSESYIFHIFKVLQILDIRGVPNCLETIPSLYCSIQKMNDPTGNLIFPLFIDVIRHNVSAKPARERLFRMIFGSLTNEQFESYLMTRQSPEDLTILMLGCRSADGRVDFQDEERLKKLIKHIRRSASPQREDLLGHLFSVANELQMHKMLNLMRRQLGNEMMYQGICLSYSLPIFKSIIEDTDKVRSLIRNENPEFLFAELEELRSCATKYIFYRGLWPSPSEKAAYEAEIAEKETAKRIMAVLKEEIALNRKDDYITHPNCPNSLKNYLAT